MPFLKRCPSCGRRFGVSVESRKLLDIQRETEETPSTVLVPTGRGMNVGTGNPVTRSVRVGIERDNYETQYKCRKCGNSWSKKSTVVRGT